MALPPCDSLCPLSLNTKHCLPPHSTSLSTLDPAMASSTLLTKLIFPLLLCLALSLNNARVGAQIDETSMKLMSDALEWPATMSLYDELDGGDNDEAEELDGGFGRRSLFWRRMRYYISYGALSANRIPCPPRSGRSYYTHNCFKARGPVHPYSRGCSVITRCRR